MAGKSFNQKWNFEAAFSKCLLCGADSKVPVCEDCQEEYDGTDEKFRRRKDFDENEDGSR